MTHDPLVVNTQDGTCWTRRAVTRDGHGLYAMAGTVAGAPVEVLSTLAELAEHGLASMSDALPVPVGPEPRTLDQVENELTGANLSLYEEEQLTARLRLALASAQRGRRAARALLEITEDSRKRWRNAEIASKKQLDALRARVDEVERAYTFDTAALKRRVAELEAERHSTNEVLSEAAEALRRNRDRIDKLVKAAGPDGITRRIAPTQTLREDGVYPWGSAPRVQQRPREDEHDSPLHHDYRVGRDLPAPDGAQ